MTAVTALSRPTLTRVPIFAAAAAYVVALSWAMQRTSFDVWGGMIVLPALLAVTIPLVTRGARQEGDVRMVRILSLAVVAKLVVGTLARYAVIFAVYGSGDAQGYDGAGRIIAAGLRQGSLDLTAGGGSKGTQAVNIITGLVYTVIGPTKLGGFLVFSWLAFLGLFLIYRAYRLAVPHGDHHRYALLLFFLPTILFWPSSLGKEAWLTFALGVSIYGTARIFARRKGGFIVLAVGMWATAIVRPHLALLVFVGLAVGYLLRRSSARGSRLSAGKIVGVVVLLVVGVVVAGRFQSYFNLEELDSTSVEGLLDRTAEQSTKGGSSYDAVSAAQDPTAFPQAVLAVLFRPFPFEAGNVQALATSLEGVFLLSLFLSPRRLASGARELLRTPFVAFSLTFTLLFVVAFSAIGNFGILARQRSLVYPLLIVLVTLPIARREEAVAPG
ncbi:MAG: hypothetical protein ACR2G7_05420 [Acidimicrobiales bacterium]